MRRARGRIIPTEISDETADQLAAAIASSPQAMIVALRKDEQIRDRRSRLLQWRENRLSLICRRQITVMPLEPGQWRCCHPTKGWIRGREGVIPKIESIAQPGFVEVRVAADIADAIILRELGEKPPA